MTEHPLLLNDEGVRAVLRGAKTQTRRPVKSGSTLPYQFYGHNSENTFAYFGELPKSCKLKDAVISPFGVPGDVVWVRECWAVAKRYDAPGPLPEGAFGLTWYRADRLKEDGRTDEFCRGRWRSSRFMPKLACRIRLTVKRVWVEKIQNITATDIKAEGLDFTPVEIAALREAWAGHADDFCGWMERNLAQKFGECWNGLYLGSWARNELWCCEFEKMEG